MPNFGYRFGVAECDSLRDMRASSHSVDACLHKRHRQLPECDPAVAGLGRQVPGGGVDDRGRALAGVFLGEAVRKGRERHDWPTTWLVDRQGIVRYRHIGEGAYDETEAMIQALLKREDR